MGWPSYGNQIKASGFDPPVALCPLISECGLPLCGHCVSLCLYICVTCDVVLYLEWEIALLYCEWETARLYFEWEIVLLYSEWEIALLYSEWEIALCWSLTACFCNGHTVLVSVCSLMQSTKSSLIGAVLLLLMLLLLFCLFFNEEKPQTCLWIVRDWTETIWL